MHETGRKTKLYTWRMPVSERLPFASIGDKRMTCACLGLGSPLEPSCGREPVSNLAVCGLHPSFTLRVPRRRARLLIVLRGLVTLLVLAANGNGCSAPAQSSAPLFGSGVFHPPPKPGDSIAHSLMCECKTCDPSDCCNGPDDDAPKAQCADSYDFTSNDSCGGLSIKSCSTRCTRQIWRVPSGRACADLRPASCCEAG